MVVIHLLRRLAFVEFRRVKANFDEFIAILVEFLRILYRMNQFLPSVLIRDSVFIVFIKSPRLRNLCSSVLLDGSTSLIYS